MPFTIRVGGVEDLEQVYRLNRTIFSEYWSSQSLLTALETGYDLLICEHEKELVAYLLALQVLDEIQIMQIAVAEPFRRQGLASRLTDALIRQAHDVVSISLEVRQSNNAARKLYAGLGFEEVGYRRNYYGPDAEGYCEDAVLMTRHLPQAGVDEAAIE